MALTQDDLQAINGLLTPIREEQKRQGAQLGRVEKRLGNVETTVGQMKSTLEAVTAGGQTLATKADVHEMMGELKNHKRRIENLEEETGTPNPYKH
jgi:phage shock protein A